MAELPPGVTIDDKAEEELAAAFGVGSNAEELVRQNRARYSPEKIAAARQSINAELTSQLYEGGPKLYLEGNAVQFKDRTEARKLRPDLEEAVGHPVVDAVVRGLGRRAFISYVYVGPAGSYEKDVIPFAQVYGDEKGNRPKATTTADSVLSDAEREAEKLKEEARAEAEKIVAEAREKVNQLRTDVEEEIQDLRESAAEKAVAQAEAEAEDSEKGDSKPSSRSKAKAAK